MNLLSASYTLESPGQNYPAIYEVIRLVSAEFSHIDESQFLIKTPYTEPLVRLLLWAEMDVNDHLLILDVSGVHAVNCRIAWQVGAQGSPSTRLEARRLIHELRRVAALKQRLRA